MADLLAFRRLKSAVISYISGMGESADVENDRTWRFGIIAKDTLEIGFRHCLGGSAGGGFGFCGIGCGLVRPAFCGGLREERKREQEYGRALQNIAH